MKIWMQRNGKKYIAWLQLVRMSNTWALLPPLALCCFCCSPTWNNKCDNNLVQKGSQVSLSACKSGSKIFVYWDDSFLILVRLASYGCCCCCCCNIWCFFFFYFFVVIVHVAFGWMSMLLMMKLAKNQRTIKL